MIIFSKYFDLKNKQIVLISPILLLLSIFFLNPIWNFNITQLVLILVVLIIQIANISLSTYIFINRRDSLFLYFFNSLFILGTVIKLILHKPFPNLLREPIGFYKLNQDITEVIIISIVASLAISTTLLINFFSSKLTAKKQLDRCKVYLKHKFTFLFLLFFAIILAAVNFKYNILMLGFTPNVIIPFHGNAFFFLILTRVLPFLVLFTSFKVMSFKSVIKCSIFFLIISVAVLSRMGIALFVFVLFFSIIYFFDFKKFKLTSFAIALSTVLILITTTVGLSSSARDYFFYSNGSINGLSHTPLQIATTIVKNSISSKTINTLADLTIARWVGLEGIMAVSAYPSKGWNLFIESLQEPPYKGNSFYNKILYGELLKDTKKAITTSVPGPIAFFYYSGSKTTIYIFLTFFLVFFSFLEKILYKYYHDCFSATSFVVVFTVMDFHQFGIAPLSFFKYLFFTIFFLLCFYPLKKYLGRIIYE